MLVARPGRSRGEVGHAVARLCQTATLALVDAWVVGLVDHGEMDDTGRHAGAPMRSFQRLTRPAAVPTNAPSSCAQSMRRQ